MLDDLVKTIETLRERISTYADELSKNEIRTRAVLIDPMLKVLGWDVADPALVTVEYEVPPGRADYGLRRGLDNPPAVLVEAKRFNEPLDSHVGQLLNYALVRGVRYGCLTDGNIWEIYDVFQQVPLEERKILSVVIADGEPAKVALAMIGLWQRSLQDGSLEHAVEPLIEVEDNAAPEPIAHVAVAPVPQPIPAKRVVQPSATVDGEWTSLTEDFGTIGNPPPKAIRFPNGIEKPTKYWFEVLKQTAVQLSGANLLTPQNCQIKSSTVSGSTRYLFSLDGKHSNGAPFAFPSPLGDTGIIVETNVSARDSVRQTKRLLEHFGQDPSQVYLKLS